MTDKKEPKPVQKQPDQLLREFLDKERLTITATPRYVSTNHGTFETEVQVGVRKKSPIVRV